MNDARLHELKDLLPQCLTADWVRLGSRLVRLLRDQRHAASHGALLDRLLQQARASRDLRERRRQNVPRLEYPPDLPITTRRLEIVEAIRRNQVVVIAGETGSGKTTQIPKMCLEAGMGIEAKIGCTQPRRVAALSISRRLADELQVNWGREVGCKIRFDDRSSGETYIKLMTDGILLAEMQGDPLLSEYNAIIIDEAHERSLNIDFLLGYLKGLLVKRPELKLIITSATIDTATFSKAFNDAPIIEVSGRVYPVQVIYAPLDEASEESGDLTYIDAAVRAVETALCEPGSGDVLVFMPSERDIREASDQLDGRFGGDAEIIPLFGRLGSADQQKVFNPSNQRKVIIATNIAETSLTIPGIRFVIDTGLARISRYNPRTRTRRLPIEPVSQSSANQRKGRSGRMQDGICVRLYSETDFLERPAYTQPEIQRSNLAEVILRMKTYHLGDIETFPFVNPPPPAAIQGGYSLLQELGALDENRVLTDTGCDLGRLPIDPTLGRMLLQSQKEKATREILIIASGLSIQDPRERPLDQKDASAAAHKKFNDPQSDFLTLLNIWNAVHDQWENLRTQNQRRKFCKAHFLSYVRLREWQDIHSQLSGALEDMNMIAPQKVDADYVAIHRSILTGLLGHIAHREESNIYKTSGNRKLAIFPGSALHFRGEKPKPAARNAQGAAPKPPKSNQPAWVMAGEIVETSQLFARTVAGIDPMWIVQVAPHCCKFAHINPHWSPEAGRVLVEEKVSLYGLELTNRKVSYGNIDSKKATEIFIRSALVEENLLPAAPRRSRELDPDAIHSGFSAADMAEDEERNLFSRYPFLRHNRQVRQKIETWQTRARRHDFVDLDQALLDFYARHLKDVSSVAELNRWTGGQENREILCITESDLVGGQSLSFDEQAFPDTLPLSEQPVEVSYAYAPGEENDGVTLKLPFTLAQSIPGAMVEWAVPGLREGMINELLRALPKALRKELMPFPPKVEEILRDFQPAGTSLKQDLARFIHRRYGIEIPPSAWGLDQIPAHLRPRIEVVDTQSKTVGHGRDLDKIREQLSKTKVQPAGEEPEWKKLAEKWERFALTGWTPGDVPERILLFENKGMAVYAFPGLQSEEGVVHLKLFRTLDAAKQSGLKGIQRLVELTLQKDFAWLQKDLRTLSKFNPLLVPWAGDEVQEDAFEMIKMHLLPSEPLAALSEKNFLSAVEQTKLAIPGIVLKLADQLGPILQLRQEILRRFVAVKSPVVKEQRTLSDLRQLGEKVVVTKPSNPVLRELEVLLPEGFLRKISFARLPHLQRYLKALLLRGERAVNNPVKDLERARQAAPYVEAHQRLESTPQRSAEGLKKVEELRWMIEEFKVSLFAQELGTSIPISAKRLDQQLESIRMGPG